MIFDFERWLAVALLVAAMIVIAMLGPVPLT
jgi:hypothetical protein